MTKLPLTVIILTLNEESNLPYALRSVIGWAEEIVVVDSGSTDSTLSVAKSFGARVVAHRFEDYSKQRTFALRCIPLETDWVLFLDADEWVPPALRAEISTCLMRKPRENGFFLTFSLIWMGKPIRFGYRPSHLLRLVRHQYAQCDTRGVNEHLTVAGETGFLRIPFIHEDRKGISEWIGKHNRYATLEAALLPTEAHTENAKAARLLGSRAERTRWIRTRIWRRLPSLVRPWLYFVYRYFLLGGVLDGRAGLSFHFFQALWYQSLIDMKALEQGLRTTLEAVRAFWEDAACGEALYLRGVDRLAYDEQARERYRVEPYIAAFAGFDQSAGRKILEIGLGLGADHQRFCEGGARLFGVDVTTTSVVHCRRRFQALGYPSALQLGNAERLAFRDESLDTVYAWGVLHHVPHTPDAIQEVWRVLKPGGDARVMIYHSSSFVGYMLWLRYGLARLHPFMSLKEIYAKYLESPGTKAYSVEEARELFARFRRVEITTQLTHGDLLTSAAGQRHRGVVLSMARLVWPRWIIQRFFPSRGLFMLIRAVK